MASIGWKNTHQNYGWVSILLHWIMALGIIGLWLLGTYMVTLDYYHPWYQRLPHIHRSLGLILALLLLLRILWRWRNPVPQLHGARWERTAATLMHGLLYLMMAILVSSGYLLASTDTQAIAVFNWGNIPAAPFDLEQQTDLLGEIHKVSGWLLLFLLILHTGAALKHHFIDHDPTLLRMLVGKTQKESSCSD